MVLNSEKIGYAHRSCDCLADNQRDALLSGVREIFLILSSGVDRERLASRQGDAPASAPGYWHFEQ
jgi:hypothetical protein